MTPEIYRKAGEFFHQLREVPGREFGPALDACCAGNVELRAQVMRLIDADRNADGGNFLERLAVEDAARLIPRVGSRAARRRNGDRQLPAGRADWSGRNGFRL